MFGKKLSTKQLANIANVSMGSGLDYFTAAVASKDAERAGFLILAHTQAVTSASVWALVTKDDKSYQDQAETAVRVENSLRVELLWLVEKGIAAGAGETFPSEENLRQLSEESSPGRPRALDIGLEKAWDGPFANVYVGDQ